MEKIAIVEDDVFLREELQNILEKEGYSVECISSFDICHALKARGIGPILVLTSRNQLRDELHALDLGADDYLTKPCHPKRLIARIQKLLDLYANIHVLLDAGDFQLDKKANVLYVGKKSISLSENEGIIMKTLVKAIPSVVKKEKLFNLLWGSSEYVDENILQVNMTRLRKTLDEVGLSS